MNQSKQAVTSVASRILHASLLCLCAAPALAGMPGFTGVSAAADSAETSISNPAGMERLGDEATSVRLVLAQNFGKFDVDESRTNVPGGNPDNELSPVFVPLGFYVRQISDNVHAGISFTVPSGFGTSYGGDWAGRYYADSYSLVYLAVTPALSWRLNDQWSVGGALGINYTMTESEAAINNQGPIDGKLQAKLDGIGTNFSVSTLWEMDEHTRFGAVYTSEATSTLKGSLDYKTPGPALIARARQGKLAGDIEVDNTLPQRANAGVYHDLASGGYVTADVMWMDFSEFGTSSVSLEGKDLNVGPNGGFQDFHGGSLGYGFPVSNGQRFAVGAFYVTSPVDKDKRSIALPLDRIWGIGAGVQTKRSNGSTVDLNVDLVNTGAAPVDTGPSLVRGRVAGETNNPYVLVLDAAYHF